MNLPSVTAILPVYNRLVYLKAAVESVFEQDYENLALIIVDDGSATETQEYLASLQGRSRVKIIRLQHCGVPAAVRNAGLRAVETEFVAFLDSDDVWMPNKLHTQMQALYLNPDCEWCYTQFTLIDGAGRPLPKQHIDVDRRANGNILDSLLTEEITVVTPSVIARRRFLEGLGGFNETLKACEDYDLWLRMADRSSVLAIDQPLVLVRRHREHSTDDVVCLQSLQIILASAAARFEVAHLMPRLAERRMRVSVNLARAYAINKQHARMLAVISASAAYSWRHPRWWIGGLESGARALSPAFALNLARKWRASHR